QASILPCVAESSIARLIVLWDAALQRIVPDRFLGRVMGLDWIITIAGLPLSCAVVAPLAQWIGVDTTLIIAGVVGGAVTIGGMFIRGAGAPVRDGRLAEAPAVGAALSDEDAAG